MQFYRDRTDWIIQTQLCVDITPPTNSSFTRARGSSFYREMSLTILWLESHRRPPDAGVRGWKKETTGSVTARSACLPENAETKPWDSVTRLLRWGSFPLFRQKTLITLALYTETWRQCYVHTHSSITQFPKNFIQVDLLLAKPAPDLGCSQSNTNPF